MNDAVEPTRILIASARFYEDVADELERGAIRVLEEAGAAHETITVPGAFELPAAIEMVVRGAEGGAERWAFHGVVALGCVIRGATSHYDYVCGESARGLQNLAMRHCLPVGYGILTCETRDQAWDRAAMGRRDKGGDAARACLQMVAIKRLVGLLPA